MKKSELFETLEPPPYGWARVSARLEVRRQPRWQLALAAAFALAIVISGTLTSDQPQTVEVFPGLALGLDAPEATEPVAITGGSAALLRLPSSNPKVVMYRLASLDANAAPPSE